MARGTLRSMIGLLAALGMMLTGCTAHAESHPPQSLRADERLGVFETTLDGQWGWVADRYPEAVRPTTEVIEIIQRDDWDSVMVDCLNRAGVSASLEDSGGYSMQAGSSGGDSDLAVAQYRCTAEYPDQAMLDFLLSEEQRGALYDYYVSFVRPCLLTAGERTTAPPPRGRFVDKYYSELFWHPYNLIWQENYSNKRWAELERRCPPEPTWNR